MGRLDHLFMEFSFLIEWSGRGHQKIILFSFPSGGGGETWLTDQTLSYCDTCWNIELFNTLNTTSSIKSGVISSFSFKMLLQQHYFVIFIIEKSPGCRKQSLLWGSTPWPHTDLKSSLFLVWVLANINQGYVHLSGWSILIPWQCLYRHGNLTFYNMEALKLHY